MYIIGRRIHLENVVLTIKYSWVIEGQSIWQKFTVSNQNNYTQNWKQVMSTKKRFLKGVGVVENKHACYPFE
jgi:hypothetical protein